MANQYNNYNNNRGYRNNNYNNNRNNNYRNNRPQNENRKPAFDASKYKKPDIDIKGLSGTVYTINGNFSFDFASVIFKTNSRIENVTGKDVALIEKFPEIYELLKEWTLELLNHNVNGITYTMDAVNKDFNDLYVMYNLLQFITDFIAKDAKETPIKVQIMQDQEEIKNNGAN